MTEYEPTEDHITRLTTTSMLYDGMRDTLNALRGKLLRNAEHCETQQERDAAEARFSEALVEMRRVDPDDRAQIIEQTERWASELSRLRS